MALKKFTIEESHAQRSNMEDEFFQNDIYLSYSGLNKLLYSPTLYYKHYVLKQREDKTEQAALEGKLIHCLLLTPDKFDEEYQIVSEDLPSENPRKVIDTVYQHYCILKESGDEREELIEFGDAVLDVLQDMNLYQSLKTDAQRIAKIVDVEKHKDYWWYLKNTVGKILITQELYDFAQGAVEKVTMSPVVLKAMGFISDTPFEPHIDIHNEIELVSKLDGVVFGLKGIIDNLVIDHDNKIIKVNDFKTTSKDLNTFKESVEFYRYWMQLCIYDKLIKNSVYYNPKYSIEHRFIVIDCYQQVGTFLISEETFSEWMIKTDINLNIANYHLEKRCFDLPYEFAVVAGEMIL